jgi:arylsulfatase A-like enzyme
MSLVLALSALACLYAVLNIVVFGIFGGFVTYPLLLLIGSVRMLSSSIGAYVTLPNLAGLIGVPLLYLACVWASLRLSTIREPARERGGWMRDGLIAAGMAAWMLFGQFTYASDWRSRQERRIAENPHWVILSSWWLAVSGDGTVRMDEPFLPADLGDFDAAAASGRVRASIVRRRPPHVIFLVLESVGARWTGLNGQYDTTPALRAAASEAVVFENAYAHIGRSSNSLAAMLLSIYPKLGFRESTEETPASGIMSLATHFRAQGYRTAFLTNSDFNWAGWDTFLAGQGFDELRDYHRLPCTRMISSWGVEDRCAIEALIDLIDDRPAQPLFLMGWTTQTHHPYEPTPGVPMLSLLRERIRPEDYDLWRYLNVLRETDRHLGRLFEAIRRAGLADDTLVVVVGDHGQAFGFPHDSWMQGKTVYEEDVHVPLMFWFPRLYRSAVRSQTIGSHVDLAPTIAELAGLPGAAEWQGRSLFASNRAPRAYFYVAEDHFTLGVREDNWKYIFDLREGSDELYDLTADPDEQRNLVKAMPERAARMRQRLAAWTEANRRQYERPARAGLAR